VALVKVTDSGRTAIGSGSRRNLPQPDIKRALCSAAEKLGHGPQQTQRPHKPNKGKATDDDYQLVYKPRILCLILLKARAHLRILAITPRWAHTVSLSATLGVFVQDRLHRKLSREVSHGRP
jgi:hypothetical protein